MSIVQGAPLQSPRIDAVRVADCRMLATSETPRKLLWGTPASARCENHEIL